MKTRSLCVVLLVSAAQAIEDNQNNDPYRPSYKHDYLSNQTQDNSHYAHLHPRNVKQQTEIV